MPTVLHVTELIHCGNGALTVLWTVTLIASAICGLLIYSIVSFRETPSNSPVVFVRRTAMEVVWAMVPILILIGTAMPSVKALMMTENSCSSVPEVVRLQ